jgi:hypothetical protein
VSTRPPNYRADALSVAFEDFQTMRAHPCPICGKTVRDPEGKPEARLLCTKCHTPFYVNASGRVVVGEPTAEDEFEKVKKQVQEKLTQVPVKKVVIGLAALVLVWLGVSFLLRPADQLRNAAESAAQAFAGDDLATLKSLAAPDTVADLTLWFQEVHPWLVQARQKWQGKAEIVEAHVVKENRQEGKGVAGLSIHTGVGTARDVGLANPTEATASAPPQVDVETQWTLDKWGHWKLDGQETYARAGEAVECSGSTSPSRPRQNSSERGRPPWVMMGIGRPWLSIHIASVSIPR